MPLMMRRSSTLRAPGWFCGMNGSTTVHCSSENQNIRAITDPMLNLAAQTLLMPCRHTDNLSWL